MKNKGFTLAEVLITLGIIGVVAAMTLPAVISKYQKKQTVNQLKKVYSELNQAIRLAESDKGTMDSWSLELDASTALAIDEKFGEEYLYPNLKILKKCNPTSEECFSMNAVSLSGSPLYFLNGSVSSTSSFIAASGYSVAYWLHATGTGGWFWVDVNGPMKGPNMVGKDIFPFMMNWSDKDKRLGFLPKGVEFKNTTTRDELINGTANNSELVGFACDKNKAGSLSGGYCAALIMLDGWEIKDDYPW